jgi:hypothetical protein
MASIFVCDDAFLAMEMELSSFSQALPAWAVPAQDAPSKP